METEISSKYNFLTVISNHHRIFFSLISFSEKDELLHLNVTLYLGAFLPEPAYCQSDKSEQIMGGLPISSKTACLLTGRLLASRAIWAVQS